MIPVPAHRRKGNGKKLVVRGARANNLKDIDVAIPLGSFVAVSGVRGSGKSSLITGILSRKVAQYFYRAKERPGPHDSVDGLDNIDKAIDIDQSPIFFFQAEDGIRDGRVTGVQTCALPI